MGKDEDSSEDAWQSRAPLTTQHRQYFDQLLTQQRMQNGEDVFGPAADDVSFEDISRGDQARTDRLALERTLVQFGYLTKIRMKRPAPKRKRLTAEKLDEAKLTRQKQSKSPAPKVPGCTDKDTQVDEKKSLEMQSRVDTMQEAEEDISND
jgi:hypothetical protein